MIKPPVKLVCLNALLFSVLICLSTGKLSADALAPVRTSYTLPFTLTFSSGPVVQVTINDKVMGTFLIDTGSSANTISDTMVAKLGLTPEPVVQGAEPFLLNGKPAMMVTNLKLQIGQLTLQGSAFPVIAAKTLHASVGVSVDGIISMQVLRYFAMDVDFPHNRIILTFPGGLTENDIKEAGFRNSAVVPLLPNIGGQAFDPAKGASSPDAYWRLVYSVPTQISDGRRTMQENLIVDTGAKITFLPAEVSRSLKLEVHQEMRDMYTINGISASYNVVNVPLLTFGTMHLSDHQTGVYRDSSKSSPTLGLDVLANCRVLMDFPAKKMYLQSNTATAVPKITVGPQTPGAATGK